MDRLRGFESDRTTSDAEAPADLARSHYQQRQTAYWDAVALREGAGRAYGRRLSEVYRLLIPPGKRVLEIGCGRGDLLAAVEPVLGVGLDLSDRMIERAKRMHPTFRFHHVDAAEFETDEAFDFIILSDVLDEIWDPLEVLRRIRRLATSRTRLIVNTASRYRGRLRTVVRRFVSPSPPSEGRLAVGDVMSLLHLADFEVVRHRPEVLLPLAPLSTLADRYLCRIRPFSLLAMTHVFVARPVPSSRCTVKDVAPVVSVIIPARNEAGTVSAVFERTPEMGAGTELIFVEGGSSDDTYGAIERAMDRYPGRRCRLLRQEGRGKGDAVRMGFAQAAGDVLMILDADLAVPPEDLPKFLDALISGKADLANGSRLILPMEPGAMRSLNLLANRFFGLAFSRVLGQPVRDTLCGTKVLWREDYAEIAANRSYFGDFDPFGDFDLLLGAARLNLKILDIPVRYRNRVYGTTNIDRWRHGLLLFQMLAFAARKMLFV
jgi:ubiquinone/menaquinone biosynthesis C-methylase UbiE